MQSKTQPSESFESTGLNHFQKTLFNTLSNPMTRQELVEALNRPRTTIYDNLNVLMNQNKVTKFSRQVNPRGRPFVYFKQKI